MPSDVVIVSGARTPIGRLGGAFKDMRGSDLGAIAIRAAVERAGIAPEHVDEVIMGNVLQAAESGYAARRAALAAGLPDTVPAMTVNRACSSGLEAVNLAVQSIATGESEIVVAGGLESMSQAPHLLMGHRFDGPRMGDVALTDSLQMGLSCPVYDYHMGVTAENVAERFEVGRVAQDELAVESHRRAVAAQTAGRFEAQIVPVAVPQRRGAPVEVSKDEHPRADTSLEALAKLPAAFKDGGTVTAGNSAGVNDAAAAVVVMSAERATAEGVTPRLRWIARGVAGVDPAIMGTGPVPATRKVLAKTGIALDDIDVIELNEAFAAQALYV
ncbi:MAG: acetyl-CoA C-acyltransferase, partial [Chloroflexi bacterium]|nr:acetyl-CoA C-acyltransferase [Chloroflexota bacterium]